MCKNFHINWICLKFRVCHKRKLLWLVLWEKSLSSNDKSRNLNEKKRLLTANQTILIAVSFIWLWWYEKRFFDTFSLNVESDKILICKNWRLVVNFCGLKIKKIKLSQCGYFEMGFIAISFKSFKAKLTFSSFIPPNILLQVKGTFQNKINF